MGNHEAVSRYLSPMTPTRSILLAACLIGGQANAQSAGPPQRYLDQFIDPAVTPGNDFYGYSVGKWIQGHPIPKSERAWGMGDVIQEEPYRRLLDINKTAAATGAPGGNRQKIGDFWHTAMDTIAIARQGFAPLDSEFARIAAVKDLPSLASTIARLNYIGVGALYELFVSPDAKHSERNAAYLWQGGIGLPDRDYYFDADERGKTLRKEYEAHVARMLTLLGEPRDSAAAHAATVMAIETELAGGSLKLEELRDPIKNYNPMSLAVMNAAHPGHRLEGASGRPRNHRHRQRDRGPTRILPAGRALAPVAFTGGLEDLPPLAPRERLRARGGGRFDAEDFRFYGTILNGTPEQRPRWKRMLDQEENYLGDALGQLYVAKYFSPAAKQRYERLTGEIFTAFESRIKAVPWMSPETKEHALAKLHAVKRKVGYPERWKDYSTYAVDPRSFMGNTMRGTDLAVSDYENAKIGKPVDRHRVGDDAPDLQRILQPDAGTRSSCPLRPSSFPASRTRWWTTRWSTPMPAGHHRPRDHPRLR